MACSLREIEVRSSGPRNWCGVEGPPLVRFDVLDGELLIPNLVYEPERRFVIGGTRLNGQYDAVLRMATNRWGHLARTDEQRWWYLTAKLPGIAGCIYWLGAVSGGVPRFTCGGRTVNARAVPWTRNGRRTCRNEFCVRKEHAKGYFDAPAESFQVLDRDTREVLRHLHSRFRVGRAELAAIREQRSVRWRRPRLLPRW